MEAGVGTSHNHTDGKTPSITVERTDILLGQQTRRSERKQFLYTAVRHSVAWTPTQALANQRTQLQLRLQLAHTHPSANRIKYRPPASNFSQSTSTTPLSTRERHISPSDQFTSSSTTSRAFRSAVPSAAPLSAGIHHGSSPHLRGQQLTHSHHTTRSIATHRRPPTLPTPRPGAAVRLPAELLTADSPPTRTAKKTLLHQNAPFQGH
jgi:hypothetical protein